jgi:hypothetical protein
MQRTHPDRGRSPSSSVRLFWFASLWFGGKLPNFHRSLVSTFSDESLFDQLFLQGRSLLGRGLPALRHGRACSTPARARCSKSRWWEAWGCPCGDGYPARYCNVNGLRQKMNHLIHECFFHWSQTLKRGNFYRCSPYIHKHS